MKFFKYLNLFVVGVFLAAALILPGISVSYVLLIFKMYDTLLFAIKTFDLLYLLKMMIALLIGMLLVIKGLNYLIIKKNDILESVIVGFVFASVWVVLPIINSCKDLIYGMIFIILGVIIRTLFHNR
jgi:putative membrane protein